MLCVGCLAMAYGKGKSKDLVKRMVELGAQPTTAELSELRRRILSAIEVMAKSIWPDDVLTPVPQGKDIDAVMLKVQSELSKSGLNSVWGEKARLLAKAAALEQWSSAFCSESSGTSARSATRLWLTAPGDWSIFRRSSPDR